MTEDQAIERIHSAIITDYIGDHGSMAIAEAAWNEMKAIARDEEIGRKLYRKRPVTAAL